METEGLAAVIQLAEETGVFSLEEVLEHRVTYECLSLFNVNGSMRKTTKCKLVDHMNFQPVRRTIQFTSIIEMSLIWRLATPTADDREVKRRDGTECKWRDYLEKIPFLIQSRHRGAKQMIFRSI